MNARVHQRAKTPPKPTSGPGRAGSLGRPESKNREAPPIVYDVLESPGQPLNPQARAYMEPRFGHDFGRVRVHADGQARESAKAVGALAYTVGSHVVFASGAYATPTGAGGRLLAHELAHIVQQGDTAPAGSGLNVSRPGDPAEREAEAAAGLVAAGGSATPGLRTRALVLQRQVAEAPAQAGPVYNISLHVPPRPAENYTNVTAQEALAILRRHESRIRGLVEASREGHDYLREVREDQYVVGAISDFLADPLRGGIDMPPLGIWREPAGHLDAARSTIQNGDVPASVRHLQAAANAWRRCETSVIAYREGTISGASRAEVTLEVAQVAGAVSASLVTGGAGGILVGAAYTGVQSAARQGTEVSLGMRDRIDWGGITFDAFFSLLTARMGGNLGNAVMRRIAGDPRFASLGRRALGNLVSDLVTGRVTSSLHLAARTVFDNLRGAGAPVTFEQFVDRLAVHLTDPRSAFMDALMGHAQRRLAAQAAARPPAAATPGRRSTFGRRVRGRVAGAMMQGVVEAVPITGGTGGGSGTVITAPARTGVRAETPPTTPAPARGSEIVSETAPARGSAPRPTAEVAPELSPGAARSATPTTETTPSSGLELAPRQQPTRAVADPNEFDFGPMDQPSRLETDPGPQPTRHVAHREIDPGPIPPLTTSRRRARPTFGAQSSERAGTFHRTGMHYGELNAAEIAHGLRIDYDPVAGRPRSVTYRVDADVVGRTTQTQRGFTRDVSTEGAQPSDRGFTGSGQDRGHLAQREAFRGDPETERAVDQWTGVVPMHPNLNRGAGSPWRASEQRAIDLAQQHGSVMVRNEPIYDANPPRLPDGTPIPRAVRRTITAPDGTVLEDITHLNR